MNIHLGAMSYSPGVQGDLKPKTSFKPVLF